MLYFEQVSTKMAEPTNFPCKHKRTQLIAKDNEAQYVECLDCGQILESGEIEKRDAADFDESLSDA
jgi:hypothetical protein